MVKRRTFKKTVNTAVKRAISKYQRRKLNYILTVSFVDGAIKIDGQDANVFTINDLLTGNVNEFQYLGKQYAMVKLRGLLIEALPVQYGSGGRFGFALLQTNDSINFDNIKNQPNLMICAPNIRSRMYVPISGEYTSTNSIELFTNMKLVPFSSTGANANFTVKITGYLTFKTTL